MEKGDIMNRFVYGHVWSPEAIRDLKHFTAVIKGWYPDAEKDEIEEAYTMITGKEIKKSTNTKKKQS